MNSSLYLGLKAADRVSVQEQWSNGECGCVCATVSFGMGVDKATVRAVVHWGLSQNVAAYYQVTVILKKIVTITQISKFH